MFDDVTKWIKSKTLELEIPGFIACVRHRGEVIYSEAFGVHDLESTRELDKNAVVPIGSISKAFTAHIIHRLAAQGILRLDKPLPAFFPALNHERLKSVTIADLLSHKSPLQWKDNVFVKWDLGLEPYPTKEFLHSASLNNLIDKGALDENRCDYSNLGYTMLHQIMEDKTGKSYVQNVKDYIIGEGRVSGIHAFSTRSEIAGRQDIPTGYYDGAERLNVPSIHPLLEACAGSGGLYATAPGVTQFFHDLLTGKMPSSVGFDEMTQADPKAASIMGLYPYSRNTGDYVGKKGGVRGFYSFMTHHCELGFTTSMTSTTLSFEDDKHPRYPVIQAKQKFIDDCMFHITDTVATGLEFEPGLKPPQKHQVPQPKGKTHHL